MALDTRFPADMTMTCAFVYNDERWSLGTINQTKAHNTSCKTTGILTSVTLSP